MHSNRTTLSLTRYDARRRKRLSPVGWFFTGTGVFVLLTIVLSLAAAYRERHALVALDALPTPGVAMPTANPVLASSPETAGSAVIGQDTPAGLSDAQTGDAQSSIYWTVSPRQTPDGRDVFMVDQPEVYEQARSQALEAHLYTLFASGLPDDEQLQADLANLTVDGAARRGIRSQVAEYRAAGVYWRSDIPEEIVFLDDLAAFSADGREAFVPILFPAGVLQRERVDLAGGDVVATETAEAFVLQARMFWDVNRSRWLLVETRTGAVEEVP